MDVVPTRDARSLGVHNSIDEHVLADIATLRDAVLNEAQWKAAPFLSFKAAW